MSYPLNITVAGALRLEPEHHAHVAAFAMLGEVRRDFGRAASAAANHPLMADFTLNGDAASSMRFFTSLARAAQDPNFFEKVMSDGYYERAGEKIVRDFLVQEAMAHVRKDVGENMKRDVSAVTFLGDWGERSSRTEFHEQKSNAAAAAKAAEVLKGEPYGLDLKRMYTDPAGIPPADRRRLNELGVMQAFVSTSFETGIDRQGQNYRVAPAFNVAEAQTVVPGMPVVNNWAQYEAREWRGNPVEEERRAAASRLEASKQGTVSIESLVVGRSYVPPASAQEYVARLSQRRVAAR